jgi:hypothetical protein
MLVAGRGASLPIDQAPPRMSWLGDNTVLGVTTPLAPIPPITRPVGGLGLVRIAMGAAGDTLGTLPVVLERARPSAARPARAVKSLATNAGVGPTFKLWLRDVGRTVGVITAGAVLSSSAVSWGTNVCCRCGQWDSSMAGLICKCVVQGGNLPKSAARKMPRDRMGQAGETSRAAWASAAKKSRRRQCRAPPRMPREGADDRRATEREQSPGARLGLPGTGVAPGEEKGLATDNGPAGQNRALIFGACFRPRAGIGRGSAYNDRSPFIAAR